MDAASLNAISGDIIASAIEVHRFLGPGLLESAYRKAIALELRANGYAVQEELDLPARYKGQDLGQGFRMDLLVEGCVVIECKAIGAILPLHAAQLKSCLVMADLRLGLLINFREQLLTDGGKRAVNMFPDGKAPTR